MDSCNFDCEQPETLRIVNEFRRRKLTPSTLQDINGIFDNFFSFLPFIQKEFSGSYEKEIKGDEELNCQLFYARTVSPCEGTHQQTAIRVTT